MKLTESSLRQLIRQVIREADESDKYTHIGYGKYKEKGKEKDKDAETFKKTDSGKFEPFGDKEGGEKEKPEPKQTKIAADPFADKDSETGKDYTKKFTGTDEPDSERSSISTQIEKTRNNLNKASDDQLEYIIDDQDIWGELEDWDIEPGKIPEDPAARAELTDAIYELVFKPIANDPDEFEDMIDSYELGPPKPDDLKDFLDGFGKTDVYSDGEVSNEMMGEFDFEDNKVTYSNSNFEELDDWNLAKDVLGPLKKAGIKYKKYKDEYSAGVIVNTEDLEGLTDVLKQTVGNKDGGGDAGEEKEKPKPWKSWEYKPGMGMEINPDELTGVDYNQKEMEEWVDNQRTRGVLATASRDTLAKIAKYDPKANPQSKMNSKPGGELIQHMADVFDMEADTIPLYKEIEYMAKLANDQRIPAKMADLFREASTGAREYWYVQLGLRRPEDLDTAPPSFKESIIPQLKKEFKQYDFTQKSKNWKQVMI